MWAVDAGLVMQGFLATAAHIHSCLMKDH